MAPECAGSVKSIGRMQPQRAPVGAWAAGSATKFPFLTSNDIIGLAGMRALLAPFQRAGAASLPTQTTSHCLRAY